MNSHKPEPSMKRKKKPKKLNFVSYDDHIKKFRYTGNIAHIKNFIDVNKKGYDCIVEVKVRPLTRLEKELFGEEIRAVKAGQVLAHVQNAKSGRPRSHRSGAASSNKVETTAHKLLRAQIDKARRSGTL